MLIAIFGCGQLARMTAQAGIGTGLNFSFVAEEGEDTRCVEGLGPIIHYRSGMSARDLFLALGNPRVVTVEKEMVDARLLTELQTLTSVYPGSRAIYIAQNRIREKEYLRSSGIATAEFELINNIEQLQKLPGRLGLPVYIKSAESGYDGYNQWRISSDQDLQQQSLLHAVQQGVALIAEKHVNHLREVSVIGVRGTDGDMMVYPIMENRHEEGVLLVTVAPAANLDPALEAVAVATIKKLLSALDYVGVLTMECFETTDGLVVNELAPRVHNSGHWTIEGSETSQFENHCRAISGMKPGSTALKSKAGLVNMLGHYGDEDTLSSSRTFYHSYGKQQRPRRKLGHVTVCSDDYDDLIERLNQVIKQLYSSHYSPMPQSTSPRSTGTRSITPRSTNPGLATGQGNLPGVGCFVSES